MRTYTKWTKSDIDKFVETVNHKVKEGKSYMQSFRECSDIYKIDCLTLRNLYYKVGIGRSTKPKEKPFTIEEIKELINNVNQLKKQGHSVRSACKLLAQGDNKLFLRLQNKYYSELKNIRQNNILTIKPKNKALSDEDINNLIKGFVNLIRRNTIYDLNEKYKSIIADYNIRLNNTIIELNKKNNLLKDVLLENERLKNNNNNSIDKLYDKIKQ